MEPILNISCVTLTLIDNLSFVYSLAGIPTRAVARWIDAVDLNWSARNFTTRPVPTHWPQKYLTKLALSRDRLLVTKGQNLESYDFVADQPAFSDMRSIVTLPGIRESALLDITGISIVAPPMSMGGDEQGSTTIVVGRENGQLSRYIVPPPPPSSRNHHPHDARFYGASESTAKLTATYTLPSTQPRGTPIRTLATNSASSDSPSRFFASLSISGLVSLFDSRAPWKLPSTFTIPRACNPWAAHLAFDSPSSPNPSSGRLFIGSSNPRPLAVHQIQPSFLDPTPIALLDDGTDEVKSPATHSITTPGADSMAASLVWGSSDSIVVSGWHDGVVRVHDMRAGEQYRRRGTGVDSRGAPLPNALNPVLTLADPTTDSGAVYTVKMGGGNGSHIVAGQAVHGCVSIWDVRAPPSSPPVVSSKKRSKRPHGWSVYPPESTWTSTYDIAVEGSRIWGVGGSGGWLFDFGEERYLNQGRFGYHSDNSRTWTRKMRAGNGRMRESISRTKADGTNSVKRATTYEHGTLPGMLS
ncbi:hypothetical protein DL93DRAFT_1595855 [Clavulina sp. PMI_390]|nr:hypothetical protein DL93DRAFT_1595855 [Clavulina sp. PMI_390]